jgi:hypothetical protein
VQELIIGSAPPRPIYSDDSKPSPGGVSQANKLLIDKFGTGSEKPESGCT